MAAHLRNLARIFTVRLHNIGTLLKLRTNSDLDPTHGCTSWSGASPLVYALKTFLSAGSQYVINKIYVSYKLSKFKLYRIMTGEIK